MTKALRDCVWFRIGLINVRNSWTRLRISSSSLMKPRTWYVTHLFTPSIFTAIHHHHPHLLRKMAAVSLSDAVFVTLI